MINSSGTSIDLALCTFRRPQVAETLRSLAKLATKPEWKIRVIVADNDETPSAQSLVETVAREYGLALRYIHAPARNISVARNACLDVAEAPYLAFLDDDEIAAPGWLLALMAEMKRSGADAVLGPVQALYPPDAPRWLRTGDFHSTKPVLVHGRILTGYTCNVLLRREAPAVRDRRFRTELGRTGGEDTEFFTGLSQAGGVISYAAEAVLMETVEPARLNFRWLLRRRFRAGQTHGMLRLEKNPSLPARGRELLVAAAKAIFCFAGALFAMLRAQDGRRFVWRGTLHLGVIARLCGFRERELYG